MSSEGFDTWILEFRGAGLSAEVRPEEIKQGVDVVSVQINSTTEAETNGSNSGEQRLNVTADTARSQQINPNSLAQSKVSAGRGRTEMVTEADESQFLTNFTENFMRLSEKLSSLLNEGQ